MKLIKAIFRSRSSKSKDAKVKEAETTTLTDGSGSSSTSHKDSPGVSVVKEYLAKFNEHDVAAMRKLASDDYVVRFQDNTELMFENFAEEMQKMFDSFPDFNMSYCDQDFEEKSDSTVVVHKLLPSGHHTGAPYAFGPCDPIDPTGKFIRNDPETVHFHLREEGGSLRILKLSVVPHGEMTGPQGIYTQLGGFPLM